jgi:hypothetical protein
MAVRVPLLALVSALALASVACQKLPTTFEERGGSFIDAIPADVGTLVGVTSTRAGWAHLWYQKPDRDIVIVTVTNAGQISASIVTIPRN